MSSSETAPKCRSVMSRRALVNCCDLWLLIVADVNMRPGRGPVTWSPVGPDFYRMLNKKFDKHAHWQKAQSSPNHLVRGGTANRPGSLLVALMLVCSLSGPRGRVDRRALMLAPLRGRCHRWLASRAARCFGTTPSFATGAASLRRRPQGPPTMSPLRCSDVPRWRAEPHAPRKAGPCAQGPRIRLIPLTLVCLSVRIGRTARCQQRARWFEARSPTVNAGASWKWSNCFQEQLSPPLWR